jgi:hypothetical protein
VFAEVGGEPHQPQKSVVARRALSDVAEESIFSISVDVALAKTVKELIRLPVIAPRGSNEAEVESPLRWRHILELLQSSSHFLYVHLRKSSAHVHLLLG